jgi:hypothetical protein
MAVSGAPGSIAIVSLGLLFDINHEALDIADGILAGIWLVMAVLYVAGARQLRRWEVEHDRVIVRDMRRWRWAVSDSGAGGFGWAAFSKRRWCFDAKQRDGTKGANLC